ncbi:MAG: DNA/RNA non-specific endonuclease [Bacteroidales bacterium]|nr:DNA/RNA non-specific endonuclease [Bacteroidales bacterium]
MTVSETGFYYGTTSSPSTKVTATGTSSPFSKALTGLTPNTTYYYKAYVIEGGQECTGSVQSFKTKAVATSTVYNDAASAVTSSSAQLNGHFSGATGQIYETGFYWGTSSGNLNQTVTTDGTNASSGSFSCTIGGSSPLSASTTYYFKAYVLEYDEASGSYVERVASTVQSFTTTAVTPQTGWQAYLSDYGMPNVSGLSLSLRQSGTNTSRDDKWYSVNTSNSNRQIAIHTYSQGAPNNAETLNYVVLYDKTKYAPLWTYHVMNTTYWPDNNVSRNEDWASDPAISLTQQTGLDNANTVGYSRGHLVASNYRQTTVAQNKQTFYYSNQAPQWQNGFNSGVWSTLEERVASSAVVPSGTTMLYVVTGVLYEGTTTTKPSGSLNVPIPSHFYKCIMKCTFNGSTITGAQGIAFVYTNESHTGSSYYNSAFVTTIDAIETRAGFDFFAAVPADVQNTAEANSDHRWFTGASNLNSVYDQNWGTL